MDDCAPQAGISFLKVDCMGSLSPGSWEKKKGIVTVRDIWIWMNFGFVINRGQL